MTALEWMLIVVLAYAGLMFMLFASLRVGRAADDAADRALVQLLRERRRRAPRSTSRRIVVA